MYIYIYIQRLSSASAFCGIQWQQLPSALHIVLSCRANCSIITALHSQRNPPPGDRKCLPPRRRGGGEQELCSEAPRAPRGLCTMSSCPETPQPGARTLPCSDG